MTESVNRSVDRSVHRSLDRVSFRDPTYGRTDGLTEKVLTHRNQTDRFVPHARIQTIMKSRQGMAPLRAGHPATPDDATGGAS